MTAEVDATPAHNSGSSSLSYRATEDAAAASAARFTSRILNPQAMWWECWLMPVAPSRQHRHDGYARFGNRTCLTYIGAEIVRRRQS